jgi:hypothetical protein
VTGPRRRQRDGSLTRAGLLLALTAMALAIITDGAGRISLDPIIARRFMPKG